MNNITFETLKNKACKSVSVKELCVGDLICEHAFNGRMLGKVMQTQVIPTPKQDFGDWCGVDVLVLDSTDPNKIGEIIHLGHRIGFEHYGPDLVKCPTIQ